MGKQVSNRYKKAAVGQRQDWFFSINQPRLTVRTDLRITSKMAMDAWALYGLKGQDHLPRKHLINLFQTSHH
jgi:hypothetical protein